MTTNEPSKGQAGEPAAPHKATLQAAPEPPNDGPANAPTGIGGWLLLPALHIPFWLVINVPAMLQAVAYMSQGPVEDLLAWAVTSGPLILVSLVLAIQSAYRLFTLSPAFPRTYRKFLYFLLAGAVGMWALQLAIEGRTDAAAVRDLVKNIILAAIWIPYTYKSKRVSNTFRPGAMPPPIDHSGLDLNARPQADFAR